LHVIGSISPRYGGTSRTALGLCKAQNGLEGVTAHVVATDADGAHKSLPVPTGRLTQYESVPCWIFPRVLSERWKFSPALASWLRDNIPHYDLVHVHGVFSYANGVACRAALRARVPYWIIPQGMLSGYGWHKARIAKRLYWALWERVNVARANALQATTKAEASELRTIAPDARVVVHALGVDDEAFKMPKSRGVFRKKYAIPENAVLLLALSRLHPKKGIVDLLLPALERLPEQVALVIAGGPDEHSPQYARRVSQAVRQPPLQKRVWLAGPLFGKEKWEAIDDADIAVLPSHHENFGIFVAEAMARGIPVVATKATQAIELAEKAGAGVSVNADVVSFAAAIKRLASEKELRGQMAEKGKCYAQENLSWSRIALDMLKDYRRTIETSS